jgi:isopentenyl-diphosphate delta-isomerase
MEISPMNQEQNISDRKLDHIRINLEEDVRSKRSTGLEQIELIHSALPELDLDQVDPSVVMWKKRLSIPLLISSMTGGNQEAAQINRNLAMAAQQHQIAMGLGSMRAALVRPESLESFQVRQWAPDILLFANFGAVQLNYGYSADDCRRLIDLVEADGLILHLNPLQEALQPEGDSRFGLLLPKIEAVCRQLEKPVIVKEVGWGISSAVARRLFDAGVAAIDVAGAGGTSWSQVEKFRIKDESRARVAEAFRGWGIPTTQSIKAVTSVAGDRPVIASGGLQDGIDLAKCLALGARLGGIARPFLKSAAVSAETVAETIEEIALTLRIAMFAVGAGNVAELNHSKIREQ